METIFTKIVKGEIPSYKVAETENCFAFLDISPIAKGHTLVIPKKQIDYIFDLDNELLSELMAFAKVVAKALEKVVPSKKIGISVIGLEVPHAHVHLVPMNELHDMDFKKERLKISDEEYRRLAKEIAENIGKE